MDPGAGSSPGWLGREARVSPQAASGEGDDRAATRLFSRAHPEAQVPSLPFPQTQPSSAPSGPPTLILRNGQKLGNWLNLLYRF